VTTPYLALLADSKDRERSFVFGLMLEHEGCKAHVAAAMGVSRYSLNRILERLGLEIPKQERPEPTAQLCRRRDCGKPIPPSRWIGQCRKNPSGYCSGACRKAVAGGARARRTSWSRERKALTA
jgi:hypothetical protein